MTFDADYENNQSNMNKLNRYLKEIIMTSLRLEHFVCLYEANMFYKYYRKSVLISNIVIIDHVIEDEWSANSREYLSY